jgi:putative transposase
MTLSIPRDRTGTFDPKLITKYQRRFPDFADKIISMYACGMSVREIRGHLEGALRHRRVGRLILVFFDAIRVKNRDEGFVRNKAVYIALGIRPDGTKEILGI